MPALSPAFLSGLLAFSLWGFIPLFFRLLNNVEAGAIVAHRIVWSVLWVGGALFIGQRWQQARDALKNPKVLLRVAMAALFISFNWVLFVWAVNAHRVLETSFGYFINPLISVAMGMVFLREKINKMQIAAIGLTLVGIGLQSFSVSGFPWVALGLALSFAAYGFVRKTNNVGAAAGLWLEVLLLAPLALAYLFFTGNAQQLLHGYDTKTILLLLLTGPATAIPLMAFAYAARRLPLSTIGMMQYIAPSLSFVVAIFLFHEPIAHLRFISFCLIWVALALFSLGARRSVKPVAAP